jgi:hypothetical protein
MEWACSKHGRDVNATKFWSEDLGVDGKMILECILGK